MNKQRKVIITITYNEMGIIIDTKAEEVAQSDMEAQREVNRMNDLISRADVEQTVEDNILCYTHSDRPIDQDPDTECHMAIRTAFRMLRKDLRKLPSAQPEIIRCKDCKHYKAYDYTGSLACHLIIGVTVRRDLNDFCSRAERQNNAFR